MKRKANISRKTKETSISVDLNIDGKGQYKIDTGIGFLNHMLEQLSKHSSIDMKIKAKGDTHIDLHHTTEDTGIAIGECLKKASKKFVGIKRYAHAMIPMDETLTRVALDVSNRPYLIWKVDLNIDGKGKYKVDTGIGFLDHMLEQLSKHSSMDINIKAKGDTHIDLHHTTEDTGIAIGECLKKASKKFVGIKRYAHAMIPMDETLTRVCLLYTSPSPRD